MKWLWLILIACGLCACRTEDRVAAKRTARAWPKMERIIVAPDGRGFVLSGSGRPFRPWGMNYGNAGRLMEDFWDNDWQTFAQDFRDLKALGANVVRVHLQFGKFMRAPNEPDAAALRQFNQ